MKTAQIIALLLPPLLIVSMSWTFRSLDRRHGYPGGYLLGFVIYWLLWCLLIPTLLLGGIRPLLALFHPLPAPDALSWQTHLALWWPLLFPFLFMFLPRLRRLTLSLTLVSILLAVLIGVTEEILWRGLYMSLFPDDVWLNLLYPSLMFALWHLAPQSVLPNRLPGGAASFVAYALILALTYGVTVPATGSIAWATIAHVLHDSLGLGGFAYVAWLRSDPERRHPLTRHVSA